MRHRRSLLHRHATASAATRLICGQQHTIALRCRYGHISRVSIPARISAALAARERREHWAEELEHEQARLQ
jgi:hypothetical protein